MKRIIAISIFCLSILLNIFLLLCFYVDNFTGTNIVSSLERRNLYEIPTPKRSDREAVRAWGNSLEKLNLDSTIVFFGNSITLQSSFHNYFPDKNIVNLGYGGNNSLEMKHRAFLLERCHADKIFLMAGTNDLFHVSVDQLKDRIESLVAEIQNYSDATIYIQSILPFNNQINKGTPDNSKVEQANKMLSEFCSKHQLTFIDLYPLYCKDGNLGEQFTIDGIHLGKDNAYDIWANTIKGYIYE